jgi:hypothetical protein
MYRSGRRAVIKTLQLFYECWLEVTKQKRYQDKWLTDERHYRAIKAQFSTLESLGFDRVRMNKEISTHYGTTLDDLTESNHLFLELRERGRNPSEAMRKSKNGLVKTIRLK